MALGLGLAASFSTASAADDEKPRKLFEMPAHSKEVGIDDFLKGNMEPFGAVCVAYVKENSPNHNLMKKLGGVTEEGDKALFDLHLPTGAALDWEEEESLVIIKRSYGARLWAIVNLPPLDKDPIRFPSKRGKPWKEKKVRRWMLENAFPTINLRVPNNRGSMNPFPWGKYFGKCNSKGVGLMLLNLQSDADAAQFQAMRKLRPYVEKLADKFHFAVVEKDHKRTLEMREITKMGLDETIKSELILIEKPHQLLKRETVSNNWHGLPEKYRLTNMTEEAISSFFDAYQQGKLETYWASLEVNKTGHKGHTTRLTSDNFEEIVFNADKRTAVLVAFFNDKPDDGCQDCVRGRQVWDEVAFKAKQEKQLRNVVIADIDQSANEHPETSIAQRLGQPMIMWYPPGTAKQRKKRKQVMYDMSGSWTVEALLEKVKNLIEDLEFDDEL